MHVRFNSSPFYSFKSMTKQHGLSNLDGLGLVLTKDAAGNVYYRHPIHPERYVYTCEKFRHHKRWEWKVHRFSHGLAFAVVQGHRTFQIKELKKQKHLTL